MSPTGVHSSPSFTNFNATVPPSSYFPACFNPILALSQNFHPFRSLLQVLSPFVPEDFKLSIIDFRSILNKSMLSAPLSYFMSLTLFLLLKLGYITLLLTKKLVLMTTLLSEEEGHTFILKLLSFPIQSLSFHSHLKINSRTRRPLKAQQNTCRCNIPSPSSVFDDNPGSALLQASHSNADLTI